MDENKKKKGGLKRPIILALVILILFAVANIFDLGEKITELRGWIEDLGALGPIAFIVIYIVATVAAVPGSPLSILAGAIFGAVKGVVVVITGATLGASLAFLISRYFARDAVENWLSDKATFKKLDQMSEDHGAAIVAITRLVPIFPFNLLNYGFGLTKVHFSTYFILSFICMIPGTALYVVGADAVTTAISEGRVPWILIAVLLLVFVGLTLAVRTAKKKLDKREGERVAAAPPERGEFVMSEVSPLDKHNKKLLKNVHPKGWKNPEPAERYNLVVIGAGTAGLVAAAGAAGLGAKVALIERNLMGGDCLNVGCVPSKALLRSSTAAANATRAGLFGVGSPKAGGKNIDFAAVMERMRKIRAEISDHDSAGRFADELNVDVYIGEGRFSGADIVEVNGSTLKFKKAVIATGAHPTAPPIEGLKDSGFLTNETIFNLTERPKHLVVIGGGPIGCELSQAFRRLESEVTVVEVMPQFLIREDKDAADILARAFEKEGISVLLDAKVERVTKKGKRKAVHIIHRKKKKEIIANEILVGAGRAPNVEGLNLEAVGVEHDRFGVKVNDNLRTTNRRIYAAGDVANRYKFTHTADFSARIVIQNALFLGRKEASALTVPWVTYTDPEIAHVGMYERDAAERGIEVDTFKVDFKDVDRAVIDGEEEGFVKIHVKRGTDKILGATIVGRHAGDMISEITLAMVTGTGLGAIASVIHPYPTRAEAIRRLGDEYNRTRLTPTLKKLFRGWLSLGR